ncbi:hypothetical protein P154DRAFT_532830 [Amniculicola lignicola CBS 123094]|uniref:Uncharacterized protein n=1 Tax=Amniculicola lignicola CBS 123094 TaxID=1392246 RepID=A0A6A5WLK6_9PLEO|nr:hypothetical protein P154DRAFT_532830 [Amniculicola lignicola CBS 123094]
MITELKMLISVLWAFCKIWKGKQKFMITHEGHLDSNSSIAFAEKWSKHVFRSKYTAGSSKAGGKPDPHPDIAQQEFYDHFEDLCVILNMTRQHDLSQGGAISYADELRKPTGEEHSFSAFLNGRISQRVESHEPVRLVTDMLRSDPACQFALIRELDFFKAPLQSLPMVELPGYSAISMCKETHTQQN